MRLLGKSEHSEIGPETRRIITKIERTCNACQTYAQKPRRFKFTLREGKNFNHMVYTDILYIVGKPILHVVDEATYFQALRWLEDMPSETLWTALCMN